MVPKVVIGLGFGDEGKGMAVAHETERALSDGLLPVSVRFNGGPQAGHNVRVRIDGSVRYHMHSQFGSGAMLGAKTVHTRGMLFSPVVLAEEANRLSSASDIDVMKTLTVDERCPVVLPMHVRANREIEKSRGDGRHGSTGQGVGIARACEHESLANNDDTCVTVATLRRPTALEALMRFWRDWIERTYCVDLHMSDEYVRDESRWLCDGMRTLVGYGVRVTEDATQMVRDMMDDGIHHVTFEGSQGMLLDERHGWFPHVTYGDMTARQAYEVAGGRSLSVLGVTRTYQTRHGAGPLPTEGTFDSPEPDNGATEFTGAFRCGLLDLPTLGRSARSAGVDEVAVSHVDDMPARMVACWGASAHIRGIGRSVPSEPAFIPIASEADAINAIQNATMAPVTVVGRGNVTDQWHDVR